MYGYKIYNFLKLYDVMKSGSLIDTNILEKCVASVFTVALFHPQDRGRIFFQNTGKHLMNYSVTSLETNIFIVTMERTSKASHIHNFYLKHSFECAEYEQEKECTM
jgi:hypothetical protein